MLVFCREIWTASHADARFFSTSGFGGLAWLQVLLPHNLHEESAVAMLATGKHVKDPRTKSRRVSAAVCKLAGSELLP